VFDFDGTMVQSLDPVVDQMNRLLKPTGWGTIDDRDLGALLPQRDTRRFGWHYLYQRFVEVSLNVVEVIQHAHIDHIKAVPQLMDALRHLRRSGIRLGIVTTNSETNVHDYLVTHGWEWLFSFIYADCALFEKGVVLERLLDEHRIKPSQLVYVGDEPRDIMAAHEAGVRSIAVTWGVKTKRVFTAIHPTWTISRPWQLLLITKTVPWWKWFHVWFLEKQRSGK
jgi:phosphoglycolate phosphatase-like HAD superfamily hydrolase